MDELIEMLVNASASPDNYAVLSVVTAGTSVSTHMYGNRSTLEVALLHTMKLYVDDLAESGMDAHAIMELMSNHAWGMATSRGSVSEVRPN